MSRDKRLAALATLVAAALLFAAAPALADEWALNMPRGVTENSHDVYGLHMTILWICVAIGVVVFTAMFISILRHRKSRGVKPAQFHHSTAVEIAWTVVPLLILVSMAVPATRVLIDMEDTSNAEMTVIVTGYQWLWGYEYAGEGVHFYSRLDDESDRARRLGSEIDPRSVEHYLLNVDKPLVLPTDTKIRFQITSADVIHSWWVPALGWKRDAIPGYINETWTEILEPGIYRGQCTELCGRDHAFMPVVVKAVPPEEFERWLAEQKAAASENETADASGAQPMNSDGASVASR
jgi:cytochrome c oxidase subunit 2